MKNKSIFSIFLVFTLLFTLPISAFANESSDVQSDSFNEYEYIEMLQNSSPRELEDLGISEQDAAAVITAFEEALLERSLLPDSELRAYGYNNYEISLFHNYANGQVLSSSELQALGSTCSGVITRHSCSGKSATFSYTFTWDRYPLVGLDDSAALHWIAYDNDGHEIGVEQSSMSMTVKYYRKTHNTGESPSGYVYDDVGTSEKHLDFNTLNMQFPVNQSYASENSGIIFDTYAKTGTVRVSIRVPSGVSANIDCIFVAGLYGHTVVGIGAPSVSVSKGSFGISFTGNTSMDELADRKATIYRNSTSVEYWKS